MGRHGDNEGGIESRAANEKHHVQKRPFFTEVHAPREVRGKLAW
jgi:hypothetical protein